MMALSGEYAKRAGKSYKTVEGKALLVAVRQALELFDSEMAKPSSAERGQRLGKICSGLELAADRYDLYGEKDRRGKP